MSTPSMIAGYRAARGSMSSSVGAKSTRDYVRACEVRASLRARALWACFLVLAAGMAIYAAILCLFLQKDAVVQALQADSLFLACWLLALPSAGLGAIICSRWIARHVEAPVLTIINQCREMQIGRPIGELTCGQGIDEVRTLGITIKELLSHLDQINAGQHRFAADAAHELQTPLTAQSIVAENALARKASAAELADVIGSMLEETRHMRRLIDGLLELTRTPLMQHDPASAECSAPAVDLDELVRGCVLALQVLAEERQQSVIVHLAGPVWAAVDPTMLRQALLNVIHNAIEHCPDNACIEVETARHGDGYGVIRVKDDGPGISPEEQRRVFDRFYRGVNHARHRGLGLGLSIAKTVLQSQGGGIQLDSQPGSGCCFKLMVPLASPEGSPA